MSKFIINDFKILSVWQYNLKGNTDCTICRTNLNCNSIYAQEKGVDSYIVSGLCGHNFHYECINPWIISNPNCPICFNKWVFANKDKIK